MNIKKALAARLRKWATALDPTLREDFAPHTPIPMETARYAPCVITCVRELKATATPPHIEKSMRSELAHKLTTLYSDLIQFTEKREDDTIRLTARLRVFIPSDQCNRNL